MGHVGRVGGAHLLGEPELREFFMSLEKRARVSGAGRHRTRFRSSSQTGRSAGSERLSCSLAQQDVWPNQDHGPDVTLRGQVVGAPPPEPHIPTAEHGVMGDGGRTVTQAPVVVSHTVSMEKFWARFSQRTEVLVLLIQLTMVT